MGNTILRCDAAYLYTITDGRFKLINGHIVHVPLYGDPEEDVHRVWFVRDGDGVEKGFEVCPIE